MRHLLMRVTLAVTAATITSSVQAQVPPQTAAVPPWYPGTYSGNPYYPYSGNPYYFYPLLAPTPEDAYRDGTINRWQLEQFTGPLPPALQGPSPNGRGGDGGGSRGG